MPETADAHVDSDDAAFHVGADYHVAHQFDDAEQQRSAATLGMWAFLATEVMFFGALFCGYAVYRASYPEGFGEGAHHLKWYLGAINTAVLLTSSYLMALAVYYSSQADRQRTVRFLLGTVALGTLFLGIKAIEYYLEYAEGLIPGRLFTADSHLHNPQHVELFMSFYFIMTGLHATHMVIGLVILSVLAWMTHRGRFSAHYNTPIDMAGLYWHFVDIVWVFLFPLLYLIH